jgi:hypothetical protein
MEQRGDAAPCIIASDSEYPFLLQRGIEGIESVKFGGFDGVDMAVEHQCGTAVGRVGKTYDDIITDKLRLERPLAEIFCYKCRPVRLFE